MNEREFFDLRAVYLTNIHNPYRDEFFEQLGTQCELTVLFEARKDVERDESWFDNDCSMRSYTELFLPTNEKGLVSKTMLKALVGCDAVVVGCYNSLKQITAIEYMRAKGLPYAVNLDGPLFMTGSSIKRRARRHVLKGASAYLVAGTTSIGSVRHEAGFSSYIVPYAFSSLTERRLDSRTAIRCSRDENLILCVAQYIHCKGVDVLLDAFAAVPRSDLRLRIVGAGKRDAELREAIKSRGLEKRVETIPFLSPEELVWEYANAGLFILPSRQECWGLVINEAAACGCPIVSTWGSGAAVEFLSDEYPQFLAEPDSAESLSLAIRSFLERPSGEKLAFSDFLRCKSSSYSVESMVATHLELFEAMSR